MFVPALIRGRGDNEYVPKEQPSTSADTMDLLGGADPAESDAESVGQEVPAAIDAAAEGEADEADTSDSGEVGGAGPGRYPARQRRQVTNPAGPYQAYVGLTQDSRAADTIVEAKGRADWPLWRKAINRELSSLAEKAVYQELPKSEVPEGKNLIPTEWVFDYKRGSEGVIVDPKARWVAKGFQLRRKLGARLLLLDGDVAGRSDNAQVLVLSGVPSEYLIRDVALTRHFSWAAIEQVKEAYRTTSGHRSKATCISLIRTIFNSLSARFCRSAQPLL